MRLPFVWATVLDRAPTYLMLGLSFREFLGIRHGIVITPASLDEILARQAAIPNVAHPIPLFKEYLRNGYYPFGADSDFAIELVQAINRALEEDIPPYANLSVATGRKLKRLMSIISTIAPFKPNMTSNMAMAAPCLCGRSG